MERQKPGIGVLADRAAVVTGGSSGIGLAVVRRFAAEGARVAALSRNATPELGSTGALWLGCDVTDESQVADSFERAAEALGPLHAVVLNAGVSQLDGAALDAIDGASLRSQFEVNAMGVLHGLKHAPPRMADGGSITITATATLAWPFPDYLTYAASKAPLHSMCVHAAMSLGGRGIRVNTVSPGTIITRMQPEADAEARVAPLATCLGRVGTPEDVAGIYLFLASEDARYVTAADIRADGGWIGGLTAAGVAALLRDD